MADTSQTMMDVTRILKDDHDTVRSLLSEMKEGRGAKRTSILQAVRREFLIHSDVEEEVVYPAYKECVGGREARVDVAESLDEHRMAKTIIEEMLDLDAGSVQFEGKMKLLEESIEHHASEEEKNMFPEMREECSEELLRDLARRVEDAKQRIGKRYD